MPTFSGGHLVAFHPRDQTNFIISHSETMSTVLVELFFGNDRQIKQLHDVYYSKMIGYLHDLSDLTHIVQGVFYCCY